MSLLFSKYMRLVLLSLVVVGISPGLWAADETPSTSPASSSVPEVKTDEKAAALAAESRLIESARNKMLQRKVTQSVLVVRNEPAKPAPVPEAVPLVETGPAYDPFLGQGPLYAQNAQDTPPENIIERETGAQVASPDRPAPGKPGTAPVADAAAAAPSTNVTINLIRRLVKRGVLSPEDSEELMAQAKEDAVLAKAQATSAGSSPGSEGSDEGVRVTYVPETVKAQMRDEIKEQVMAQAREENWAAPRAVPPWVARMNFLGDVRVRYDGTFYPSGNVIGNPGALDFNINPNFNAINTSANGYDMNVNTNPNNPPQFNVDENRDRIRLRARFGTEVNVGKNFTTGFRLATGESNSPVSQNQSLGGSGGNFSKYAIWLDRGFINYDVGNPDDKTLSMSVGRFENPFFSTSAIWAEDLGFDGFAAKGKWKVADGLTPFLTVGAFPVFNTDLNFSSAKEDKFESRDKWLAAVQGGTEWKINKEITIKAAAAYYHFAGVEGKTSNPIVATGDPTFDVGNTDATRPSFAQKGNTYTAIRDLRPNAADPTFATTNQYQYFGLATPFRVVALTSRLDLGHFDPFHIWLTAEGMKNVAFDKGAINSKGPAILPGPVNNLGANGRQFEGGDIGGLARINIGKAVLEKLWDWNLNFGYRYVESDAVIDGFADSDFGGGGTNLQGYTIGGNLALSPWVWTGLKFMSADSIAGPTFKADVIQVDINAKF